MAEERLKEPQPLRLVCSEGEVLIHQGESLTLFGISGFRFEGPSGERRDGFRGRSTSVMLVSTAERLDDWSLISQGRTPDGRNQFEVLEETIADNVIRERRRAQIQNPQN